MADRFDWERALRRSGLHPTTRLVLYALGTYMNRDGTGARPTQETLAEATGLKVRAVRDHLAQAREAGWLNRTRKGRGVGRDGGVASEYEAAIPASSTGTTVPPETSSTGTTAPVEPESQPASHAPQPASHDVSTGTTVPPTKQDHVDHCSSSEQIPDAIQLQARRQVAAKRARGEHIDNEHGLFRAICQQLLDAQRLDAALAGQDQADQTHQYARLVDSYRALGRNRAHLAATEAELRAELAGDPNLLRFEDLLDEAIEAWRTARTVAGEATR